LPLIEQKVGSKVLSKSNDGEIPKAGEPEESQNQLHPQK
jgi:hypothetical protein